MPTTFTHLALAATALLAEPALGASQGDSALASLRAAAPPSTVVWIETDALEPILREGFAHPLLQLVLHEPLLAAEMKRSGFDPIAGADAVQALIGRSPFELAHQLASGGVAAGFLHLTTGSEAPFLLLHGNDADEMEDAIDTLESLLEGFHLAATPSALERRALGDSVQRSWRIHQPARKQNGLCAAWTSSGTLVITKEWKDLVAWCTGSKRTSPIAAARAAVDSQAAAFAWFDTERLAEQINLDDLHAMASEPGVHFVLGPAIAYFGLASTLSVALDVQEHEIGLSLRADGVDPGQGAGSFPALQEQPAQIHTGSVGASSVGNAQLHRDVHFLLEHRADLFPPRTQPEFAEVLSNVALLAGGPDALDDLIESLHPTIRLQASSVEFPANATPDVELPGLNVLVSLDDPELNGGRLSSAFQAAVALTNVEAAMQGHEALRLSLGMVEGVTVTTAKLPPPPPGSSVDLRFNFEPGCALLDSTFVFGTRHEGVAQFIETREQATPSAAMPKPWIMVDDLDLKGDALSALLSEQRDLLVMQAVLDDGKPQARAEAEADILIKLVRQVDAVRYRTSWCPTDESERSLRADLAIQLKR